MLIRNGGCAWLGRVRIEIIENRKEEKILFFIVVEVNLLFTLLFSYDAFVPLFTPGVFEGLIGNIFSVKVKCCNNILNICL